MPGTGDALPNPSGVKLTYDDFVLFPDDGLWHELIDGEHYVTPSPNVKHQQVVMNLAVRLGSWLEQNPIGRIFCVPLDTVLSPFDIVEPDLVYMSTERASAILTSANIQGAPELVVDVGSPGTQPTASHKCRRGYFSDIVQPNRRQIRPLIDLTA